MQKKALDIALHFLKYRARSVFEVRQKLAQKKIPEKEINDTVAVLRRNKLLDDAEFAKMYIADRNRFRPSGNFVLRMELKKLGLSENNIEDALSGQDEEVLARTALESKHKYREAEFQKQVQFLQRRGFGTSTIYKVVKNEKSDSDFNN